MTLTTTHPLSNADRLALWRIEYSPKPIRGHDYSYYHMGYDGAPDSGDTRCGTAASYEDAVEQISEFPSPPERPPERVSAWSVIRDMFGVYLVMAVCGAIVGLINWSLHDYV